MMLLMVVGGALVFAMPYISVRYFTFLSHTKLDIDFSVQKNLDPEILEEYKAAQSKKFDALQPGEAQSA